MRKTKVTIKDLAKNLNLSISTVSMILNDKQRPYVNITEETKAQVKEEARKLGYVSSRSAASLRSGQSKAVATGIQCLTMISPEAWLKICRKPSSTQVMSCSHSPVCVTPGAACLTFISNGVWMAL